MKNKQPGTIRNLAFAASLGISLLLLSFLRIWGDSGSAAFGGKIIDATMSQPIWGTQLAWNLAAFAASLLVVHVAFGVICLLMAKLSRIAWPNSPTSLTTWTLLWFVLGGLWILVANATWFPWSSLGAPYSTLVRVGWNGLSPLLGLSIAVISMAMLTIGKAAAAHPQRLARLSPHIAVLVTAAFIAAGVFAVPPKLLAKSRPDTTKPNVILIGVDSLRVDVAMGAESKETAPAIHDFLSKSVVFSNTTTPLARTFPSWVSIITGRNPHTTGAVINLFPRDRIAEGETLPKLLQRYGYNTVYAIDEVRFSNLDKSYGFDQMVAPPIGATDFILGFFSDTPLSNILVNTRVGAVLFPYAYANRAAAVTYDPSSFIDRLDREVAFDQPTFLAVHMTLAHWPFSWSSSEAQLNEKGNPDTVALYKQAVGRVDRQFNDLLTMLRDRGALDNAVVVVLSDHGESLGEPATASVPDGRDPGLPQDTVYGHGTNVFASHQYNVVLGMRTFGMMPTAFGQGRSIDIPASLEDVTPTLAAALALKPAATYDGISLLPFLDGTAGSEMNNLAERIRFSETEFNPFSLGAGMALSASALRDATEYYRVDPETDRVMIREEFVREILANRQYAASRKGSTLASIPVVDGPGQYLVYIASPGATPQWMDADTAAHSGSDVTELWQALRARFPATRGRVVLPPGLRPALLTAQVDGQP